MVWWHCIRRCWRFRCWAGECEAIRERKRKWQEVMGLKRKEIKIMWVLNLGKTFCESYQR